MSEEQRKLRAMRALQTMQSQFGNKSSIMAGEFLIELMNRLDVMAPPQTKVEVDTDGETWTKHAGIDFEALAENIVCDQEIGELLEELIITMGNYKEDEYIAEELYERAAAEDERESREHAWRMAKGI